MSAQYDSSDEEEELFAAPFLDKNEDNNNNNKSKGKSCFDCLFGISGLVTSSYLYRYINTHWE